jgi:uncharacterized protein YkwD
MRLMIAVLVGGAALAVAGSLPAANSPIDFLAPPSACPGSVRVSTGAAERRALVCLVNWARRRAGLARLSEHNALSRAAGAKAATIVACNDFAHAPCGRSPTASTAAAGYRYRFWAENLYWGQRGLDSPREAMRAWLLSAPHREHLFVRATRDLGIGLVTAETFGGVHAATVWVLLVGRRV